jgi:hypothetical protein
MAMTIETLLSILTSGLVLGGIYATVATAPAVVNRPFLTPPLRSFLKVLASCEPRKRRHMPYTPQNRTGSTKSPGRISYLCVAFTPQNRTGSTWTVARQKRL